MSVESSAANAFLSRRSALIAGMSAVTGLMLPARLLAGRPDNRAKANRANALSMFTHSTNDAALQQALQNIILDLNLENALAGQRLGLALMDLTRPNHPRLASINGDVMLYAASLPKIVILLGAFHKAEAGKLTLSADIIEKLTQMVRYSSNSAATEMMNLVGMPYIADMLQSKEYRFYDVDQGGGLWLGKAYAKTQAWKRDPLFNLSHGATSLQVAKFYYLLATHQLLSPQSCEAMLSILSNPGIQHKFVKGILAVDEQAKIFRKSGSWRDYHSDSALIERSNHRYIAVALARSASGEQLLQQLILKMDAVITTQIG